MDGESKLHTSYLIEGFRSLREFQIHLTPGINVLVGPNGSGKTNFIEFLDFLENTLRLGASAAVSNAGGLSKVFSVENIKKKTPRLFARVKSVAEFSEDFKRKKGPRYAFKFEYEIEIKFSRAYSAVYISYEKLTLKKLVNYDSQLSDTNVGSITIRRKSPSEDAKPNVEVSPNLKKNNEFNPLNKVHSYLSLDASSAIQFLTSPPHVQSITPDTALFSSINIFPAMEAIRTTLAKGKSFNIIPSESRKPDDLTRPPGIARDGGGLSSTLHFLKKVHTDRKSLYSSKFKKVKPDSIDAVLNWTRLVFPDLQDIIPSPDPFTGKYFVQLMVGENPSLKFPLQSASDGTLKWLALVCLVTIGGGVYSIEEPENFLHPKMQQYLISLIRESLSDDNKGEYFIISTHSETLINYCKPEELILFNFKDKRTICSRIKSPEKIQHEINNTGFGLGSYYASNALS